MAKTTRLNKVLRELNISIDRAVDFLGSKGVSIEKSPNTKISEEIYNMLSAEFETDASKREKAKEVSEAKMKEKEELRLKKEAELEEKEQEEAKVQEEKVLKAKAELSGPKTVGKIDLGQKKIKVRAS
jgi:translation initiation factor IF-2